MSPAEEHYLKRELLKQELAREVACLDDAEALRKFGYPFSSHGPPSKRSHKKFGHHLIPSKTSSGQDDESTEDVQTTEYPLLSHFLQHFVMKLPLLSQDLITKGDFWQEKVQVFYEHFMELQFSSSFDREELTKRKRLTMKLSKMVLLMYNSGIGCSKEVEYFERDKFELEGGNKQASNNPKLDQFVMPSKESLRFLLTEDPYYINGWDFNVMAAVKRQALYISTPEKPKTVSSPVSKWMKSPLFLSSSSFSSPSKLFSKLTMSDSSSEKGEFNFVTRVRQEASEETWYIAKTYSDFKHLVSDLRKEFPGKELPKLPHQSKIGVSSTTSFENSSQADPADNPTTPKEKIVSTFEEEKSSPTDSLTDYTDGQDESDEFQDAKESVTKHFPREKLRTSLRQFLRVLCEDNEVAASVSLLKFVNGTKIDMATIPQPVLEDIKSRESIDIANLENQMAFQKLAFEETLKLQGAMKDFKASILKDEEYLVKLFQEIKEKDSIEQLSPTLKSFMGWCRINLSATIYQTFLGNDGGYELFTQIKRLHRLLPYTVMVQILKITNPMAIMKGMMDLFMARPFGGNSLLQSMFSSVLSDDLKSQFKLARELEDSLTKESKFGAEVSTTISTAIFENEDNSFVDMEGVHAEATELSMPTAIVLAMKCCDNNRLSQDALDELIESYSLWKTRKNPGTENLSRVDSSTSIAEVPGLYFSHVKSLLQIYIRERDKRLMKKIWQDPELSQLLKSMVTLFYEPLVRIFRVSKMDVAFKNFEKFMNDLVALLDDVINGRGSYSTSFGIVDAISALVKKHEDSFFQFIHDICSNDSEKTFEGMITYLTMTIKFLQKSRYGSGERLDLAKLVNQCSDRDINFELLKEQLDALVKSKQEARQLYQKIVNSRSFSSEKKSKSVRDVMERKWRESNEAALPQTATELGLQDGDLVDLDLDVGDYAYLQDGEEDALQQEYREVLEKKLHLTEITKLADLVFKDKLKEILQV